MCPSGTGIRSQQRSSELQEAFDLLDADRDGKISKEDLQAFYSANAAASGAPEEDLIGTMISVADSNKNGFVELEELERFLDLKNSTRTCGSGGGGGIMEDAFRLMDKDGDGRLSLEDLKSFLTCAGLPATDEDVRAMIALGGGGGGLSFDALLKILGVN
ncbi:hypothetical protein Ancab_030059 [Ancistrocladus abbreviatus]